MYNRANPIDLIQDILKDTYAVKTRRAGFNPINSTICEKYNDSNMTILEFKEEFKDYIRWYANIPPSELRELIGSKIIYVTEYDKHRGYHDLNVGVIADAHRSFIIFEDGNNIDKRDIKDAGIIIKKVMTPTEIKAEEIAKQLIEEFKPFVYCFFGSSMLTNDPDESVTLSNAKKCAIISVESTIEALSSLKGMGKIQKVKLYKLVKEKLEAK